jgi:hypothetical protein
MSNKFLKSLILGTVKTETEQRKKKRRKIVTIIKKGDENA